MYSPCYCENLIDERRFVQSKYRTKVTLSEGEALVAEFWHAFRRESSEVEEEGKSIKDDLRTFSRAEADCIEHGLLPWQTRVLEKIEEEAENEK